MKFCRTCFLTGSQKITDFPGERYWEFERGVNEGVLNEQIHMRGQTTGWFFRGRAVFAGLSLQFLAGCGFKAIADKATARFWTEGSAGTRAAARFAGLFVRWLVDFPGQEKCQYWLLLQQHRVFSQTSWKGKNHLPSLGLRVLLFATARDFGLHYRDSEVPRYHFQ